jgi:hypothetical protein
MNFLKVQYTASQKAISLAFEKCLGKTITPESSENSHDKKFNTFIIFFMADVLSDRSKSH